jgi:3-deoxy-D-manno-octulosonate 8-phosphate phosphatase (KDO 8-P phosphatase)
VPADKVRLVVFDVDGVLTDGSLYVDFRGGERVKRFHVKDGLGISLLARAGLKVGLVSGRKSDAVAHRVSELGLDPRLVRQGTEDKVAVVQELAHQAGLREDEVAYMGDDLPDLAVLRRVGFPMAPADAAPEVREVAELVTKARGGEGCAREAAEKILKTQERWTGLVERFLA